MWTEKEQFRNFESLRLIWQFERPTGAEAKKKPEATENKEEAANDRSDKIKKNREDAMAVIERMMEPYKGKGKEKGEKGREAATALRLADRLKKHANAEFDDISQRYNTEREKRGETFETSQKEEIVKIREELNTRAQKLYEKIYARASNLSTYAEHQTQQDEFEAAKKEKPEKAKEMTRAAKEKIIFDYLLQAESTRGMDENMAKMLARFIVEGNLINLEYGDVDSYQDNYEGLERYFADVDHFNEHIDKELRGRLPDVIRMFLAEAPNPEATQDELNYFSSIIFKNKDLQDHYGTAIQAGSWQAKVCVALARQFDVRFKAGEKGKVLYATDLITSPMKVYDAKQFEKKVLEELKTNESLRDESMVGDYTKLVEGRTQKLAEDRAEVAEGLTWIARGGKISSWEDWPGHEATTSLMHKTENIRTVASGIETRQNAKEAQARVEAQRKKQEKAYYDAAEAAGLSGAIINAEVNGYKVTSDPEKSEPKKEPFQGYIRLSSQPDQGNNDKMDITIFLDATGKIRMNIAPADSADRIEYSFTKPEDFKKTVAERHGLAQMARKAKANVERNNAAIADINGTIKGVKMPKGLDIKFEGATLYSEMAQDTYAIPEPKLMIGDHQVGSLKFSPDQKTVTIHIEGQPDIVGVKSNELGTVLGKNMKKMKEVAERADKNKAEITAQVASDLPKLISVTPDTGLTVISEKELKGDFSKPDEKITVATIHRSDKSPVATLYIKVGEPAKPKEKTKPREYVLKVNGEDISCANIDAVNKYLADNQAELARVPEPEPEPEKVTKGREGIRDNIAKMARELWGEKMAGIKPDDPRFLNALTLFVNGLSDKRAAELGKEGATLTPKEQGALHKAFAEAFGSPEKVDENEVKLISAMKVKVKDQPESTFSKVFGDQLVRILSRSHEFKAGENGAVMVKEGDIFVPVTAEGMAKYVPETMRDGYTKILDGKATDTDRTAFQETSDTEERTQKAVSEATAILRDPSRAKALSEMGLGELIATLAQIWKMFQEAMKTGDFKSIEDLVGDIQRPGGLERMNTAKDTYTKKVGEISDTGQLLSLYADPYGDLAKKYFGDGNNAVPYRVQLRSAVQERLGTELGIDITKMETAKNKKVVTISATKEGKDYRIYLERDGSMTYATMDEIKINQEGKEFAEPTGVQKKEVRNLTTEDKNLQTVLFGARAEENPAGEKAPETANAPKGVKGEYATVEGDKIVLKGVEPVSLDKILEPDVTGGTIQLTKARPGYTANQQVEFTIVSGKIQVGGTDKKIPIHDGDIILKTTLAPASEKK